MATMGSYVSSDNEVVKVWELQSEKLFRDAKLATFFDKFSSTDGKNIVKLLPRPKKGAGDTIRIGYTPDMTETSGVAGDLTGHLDSLVSYTQDVILEKKRFGTKVESPDWQALLVQLDIPQEQKLALTNLLSKFRDRAIFNALYSPAPTKTYYGTAALTFTSSATEATAIAGATEALSPQLVAQAVLGASTGVGGTRPIIPPIYINGKPYYVMLVSSQAANDLKNNATYNQAYREIISGENNPILTGNLGIYDGVIYHQHPWVPVTSGTLISKNVLLGANAISFAEGERTPIMVEEYKVKDYAAYIAEIVYSATKTKFNSLDWAVLGVYSKTSALA